MISQFADICLIAAANVVNLALAAMFVARVCWSQQTQRAFSIVALAMFVPVALGILFNAAAGRELWLVILPALLLAHLLLTLLLDHVLKVNFRETRWLWPYLLVYYLGLMGMIGYAFQTSGNAGSITLFTYFINLGATGFSYTRVEHGAHLHRSPAS